MSTTYRRIPPPPPKRSPPTTAHHLLGLEAFARGFLPGVDRLANKKVLPGIVDFPPEETISCRKKELHPRGENPGCYGSSHADEHDELAVKFVYRNSCFAVIGLLLHTG